MHGDTPPKASVLAELAWDPSVAAAHIGVTADGGVISLTDHVGSLGEKHAARDAAARVKGVKGVKAVVCDIAVRVSGEERRDDDAIVEAAMRAIAWQAGVPGCTVLIGVEKGWITLPGQVARQFQREDAAGDLRLLREVVGLDNLLTIKPQVAVSGLSDAITPALHRSWFFDPDDIRVNAEGGTVRLIGTGNSSHDRHIAGKTA